MASYARLHRLDYYLNNRESIRLHYGDVWDCFGDSECFGDVNMLYEEYKPMSAEEFYNKYINDCTSNFNDVVCKGPVDKGRDLRQLRLFAIRYQNIIDNDAVTLEMCFDDIIYNVIIKTYFEHVFDDYIIATMLSRGFYMERLSRDVRTRYDIDYKIILKDKNGAYITRYVSLLDKEDVIGSEYWKIYKRQKKYNTELIFKDYLKARGEYTGYDGVYYMVRDVREYAIKEDFVFMVCVNEKKRKYNFFRLIDLVNMDGTERLNGLGRNRYFVNDNVYYFEKL